MTANQIAYQRNLETERANRATEQLRGSELEETIRSNRERELTNWYHEREAARHNRASEGLGWAQLAESSRHNRASESLTAADIGERARHNQVVESQGWGSLSVDQQKADTSQYVAEQGARGLELRQLELDEQQRSNMANEDERNRHNEVQERQDWYKIGISGLDSVWGRVNDTIDTVNRVVRNLGSWGQLLGG